VTPASCGSIEAARGRSIGRSSLVSLDRVRQIIDQAKRPDIQRAELESKYGTHPHIIALPDETSIEVLCLCDDIRGWTARVWKLGRLISNRYGTLGDLRRTTDAQLLREPNVGKKMLAELRRLCPHCNPAYGGVLQAGLALDQVEAA
jgi:hypothetical protein